MSQILACDPTGLHRATAGEDDAGAHDLARRLRQRVGVYLVADNQWTLLRYVSPPTQAPAARRR